MSGTRSAFQLAPQPRLLKMTLNRLLKPGSRIFDAFEDISLQQPLIEKHAPSAMVAQQGDLLASVFSRSEITRLVGQ